MDSQALEGGFSDLPTESAKAFRAIMRAMARPGEISVVSGAAPPPPVSVAAGVAILTLCDPDTNLCLCGRQNTQKVRDWVTFHTGAPITGSDIAHFAMGDWADLSLADFPRGVPEFPDRSATLIVEVPVLKNEGAILQGPGIKTKNTLSLPEVEAFATNARLFPLGLDYFFTCDTRIAGLPRTTRVS